MTQSKNGMWEQRFYTDGKLAPCWGYQVDETASVVYGVYEHYQYTKSEKFLKDNLKMCEKAIDFLKKYVKQWLEIKDKQSQIDKAKALAIKNGVEFITSTPTFEYWYMLHFEYTTKTYHSSEEVQNDIKDKIKGYTKSMNTYPVLRDKTDNAIKNARKVEKHHLDLGQALDNENCNPYTAAYKVVEELMKRNN